MSEEIKKFKLRDEKHVVAEIEIMAWSPTMDLLALANVNGEVFVNRLSWQRVWSLAPPSDGDRAGGLAWRPDGKVIAVGYKSGVIRICDVEKGDLVYVGLVKGGVTYLEWMQQSKHMCEGPDLYVEDNTSKYLPTAQQVHSLYTDNSLSKDHSTLEAHERFRSLTSQKELNLFIVGTDINEVNLFSYGAFPTGVMNVSIDGVSEKQVVDSAVVSPDLSYLSVVIKSTNSSGYTSYWTKSFHTSLLLARHREIQILASKYIMIASAQKELEVIIEQMFEAWEEILREMDSKLLKFAESKKKSQDTSVTNDFLQLLLTGTTSLELQSFLLQDLTDKGLKKLGFSIENSYSNIQKLVVKQLQRVCHNITSHLSDLYGMSQWYDKYGVLGLNPTAVHSAVQTAGAFAVKASELQQVIDTSIKNFKAFFRWLYIAILRLSSDNPPADVNRMTQHDVKFVADFLRDNFSHLVGEDKNSEDESASNAVKSSKHGFRLEKVGQYLKKEDLVQPPNYSENPWTQFLDSTTFHKDSKILYPLMHGKSIVQGKALLDQAIAHAVLEPAHAIGDSMKLHMTYQLFVTKTSEPESPPSKVCQLTDEEKGMMWVAYAKQQFPCDKIYLLRYSLPQPSELQVVSVCVGKFAENPDEQSDRPSCERHQFLDFAVFNSQTLTLMLKEDGEDDLTLLVQLNLTLVEAEHFTRVHPDAFKPDLQVKTVDVGPLLAKASVNYQTNSMGQTIAVGGIRTTASMLLRSQRRIRLFLLEDSEGNDEDDEDECPDDSTQQEDSAADSFRVDKEDRCEDEDKENTMVD